MKKEKVPCEGFCKEGKAVMIYKVFFDLLDIPDCGCYVLGMPLPESPVLSGKNITL